MEEFMESYDYEAGIDLLRQEYVAALSELRSARGLGRTNQGFLRRKLSNEHRDRCAQEWMAIRDQVRADHDVIRKTTTN